MGPVLFIIYINDLPDGVISKTKMFADDTKTYGSVNSEQEKEVIQQDLNLLMDWSSKWQLRFNVDKCKVIHYGANNPQLQLQYDK